MNAQYKWYALRVKGGSEERIKEELEKIIEKKKMQKFINNLEAPYDEVKDKKNSIKRRYSSYLLINADISDDRFRDLVVGIEGVFGFLGARGWGQRQDPVPIKQQEVDFMLKKLEKKEKPKSRKSIIVKGSKVKVIDNESSLCGFWGEVISVSKDFKTVQVSINVFGGSNQATITLAVEQLEEQKKV